MTNVQPITTTATTKNMNDIQHLVEHAIDDRAREDIASILDRISMLKPPERLLLYMRMPSGNSETDPLRQPQNPLGTRQEINQTINWVRSHLEHDPNVSIPKQDVYDDYFSYCNRIHIKPLSTADFGKVMKQVFPDIRPRRLGTRGNSRYCYAALRKTTNLTAPQLPFESMQSNDAPPSSSSSSIPADDTRPSAIAIARSQTGDGTADSDVHARLQQLDRQMHTIRQWAATILDHDFASIADLAAFIEANQSLAAGRSRSTSLLPPSKAMRSASAAASTLPANNLHSQMRDTLPTDMTTAAATTTTCSTPATMLQQQHPSIANANATAKKRRRKRRNSSTTPDNSCGEQSGATNNGQQSTISMTPPVVPFDVSLVKTEPLNGNNPQQLQQQHHQMTAYNYSLNASSEPNTIAKSSSSSTTMKPQPIYKTEILSDYETDSSPSVPATAPIVVTNRDVQQQTMAAQQQTPPPVPMDTDASPVDSPVQQQHQQHVLCKKVRQAQQTKGLLATGLRQYAVNNHATQQLQNRAASAEVLMRPPESGGGGGVGQAVRQSGQTYGDHPPTSAVAKRIALLQQYRNANGDREASGEKDDVTTDIIIPRERVISICSLDKDALDDYLNGGDNSQDQEAELLRYFQSDEAAAGANNNNNNNNTSGNATAEANNSTTTTAASASVATNIGNNNSSVSRLQVPVLENYHLCSGSSVATPIIPTGLVNTADTITTAGPIPSTSGMATNEPSNKLPNKRPSVYDKNISELRYYLQQNLQPPPTQTSDPSVTMASPQQTSTLATTSLQKSHQPSGGAFCQTTNNRHPIVHPKRDALMQPTNVNVATQFANSSVLHPSGNQQSNTSTTIVASTSTASMAYLNQSPTSARRRNFTFVPISPGPESPSSAVPSPSSTSSSSATHSAMTSTTFFGSAGSHSHQPMNSNNHPFVSPQNAMHRKYQQQQQQHANKPAANIPQSAGTAFAYRAQHPNSTTTTLSAPTSPSALQQQRHQHQHHQMQFQQQSQHHHSYQPHHQHPMYHQPTMASGINNNNNTNAHIPLELKNNHPSEDPLAAFAGNRSQSAPLHRHMTNASAPSSLQNTINNQTSNAASVASSLNTDGGTVSLAATPVPSEFCDFGTGPTSTPSPSSSSTPQQIQNHQQVQVKCEPTSTSSATFDGSTADGNGNDGFGGAAFRQFAPRDPPLYVSRSVPSTPQPSQMYGTRMGGGGFSNNFHNYPFGGIGGGMNTATATGNSMSNSNVGGGGGMFGEISKSVPTTPVDAFRYSPLELNRDFLINGNTVEPAGNKLLSATDATTFFDANDSGGSSSDIQQQQQQQQQRQHQLALLMSVPKLARHHLVDDDGNSGGSGSGGARCVDNSVGGGVGRSAIGGGSGGLDESTARMTTVIADIDELSSFSDAAVADPIIGSDLLNNL